MANYSSNLKVMPLLFNEMRKAALLKISGIDNKAIIQMSKTENIFQVIKERRKQELATKILTRLNYLSPELLSVLAKGSIEVSKTVALYGLLNDDLLFFDFFEEVYFDKHSISENYISDADFMIFFHRKAEVSPIVANWKDNNLRQLRSAYKKALLESDFTKLSHSGLEVVPPLIEKEVIKLFPKQYIKAMCLE